MRPRAPERLPSPRVAKARCPTMIASTGLTLTGLFPGDVVYVWYASLFGKTVQESLELSGFELRSQIVWAKSRFAISRGHYHWQHENCFFAVKKGANAHWMGDRRQTTLWQIDTVSGEEAKNDHGTPKPVECMRRPMLNHTKPGEAVYDPFVGSGATIIAAEDNWTDLLCDRHRLRIYGCCRQAVARLHRPESRAPRHESNV